MEYNPTSKQVLVESVGFLVIAALCIGISFALQQHFYPWLDEAQFLDPAANLYFGNGWTSTAWPYQARTEFWAGNAPLFSCLMYIWIKTFGFGISQMRSLNYFLIVIAGWLILVGVRRFGIIRCVANRLLLAATLFTGYGITFCYWSARYDILALLLASFGFLACTIARERLRNFLVFVIGFLVPLSGVQLVAYSVVMVIFIYISSNRSVLRQLKMLGYGIGLGFIVLTSVFAANGVLKKFAIATLGSQHLITGQIAQFALQGDQKGIARIWSFPMIFVTDASFAILSAIMIIVWGHLKLAGLQKNSMGVTRFGFLAVLVIPGGLFALGKFPVYYTWMAYIPVAICLVASLEIAELRSSMRVLVKLGIAAACLVGMPRLIVNALERPSYATVIEPINDAIKEGDWVYADNSAYFACRERVKKGFVYIADYGHTSVIPGIPEVERLNKLAVKPDRFSRLLNEVGGHWRLASGSADSLIAVYERIWDDRSEGR